MISDTARFHGSFFVLLFEAIKKPVSVERLADLGGGYYLISETVPVYLKHSTKRKGPWAFNFFQSHQEAQLRLFQTYGECYTCLLCGRDGIVGLCMKELRQVLDDNFEEQECITVRRKLKTMYEVRGRDGSLSGRIGRREIFDKLQVALDEGMHL